MSLPRLVHDGRRGRRRRPRARPSRRGSWREAIEAGPHRRGSILTREAFENAIAVVMAIGGSTNAVLHLHGHRPRGARCRSSLDDFEAIRARVPVLCDLKPSGRYVATDLHRAGGVPQVMKMLLDHGLLHGECPHDHRADRGRDPRRRARRAAAPGRTSSGRGRGRSTPQGHLAILRGNLATEGAVAKITGVKKPEHDRPRARVRLARRSCLEAILGGTDPERATWSSSATRGRRAARACARCSRRPRRSSARASATRSASSPTAASRAAPTASSSATSPPRRRWAAPSPSSTKATAVTIDADRAPAPARGGRGRDRAPARRLDRRPRPATRRGVLAKYARLVSTAACGAVTDGRRVSAGSPARADMTVARAARAGTVVVIGLGRLDPAVDSATRVDRTAAGRSGSLCRPDSKRGHEGVTDKRRLPLRPRVIRQVTNSACLNELGGAHGPRPRPRYASCSRGLSAMEINRETDRGPRPGAPRRARLWARTAGAPDRSLQAFPQARDRAPAHAPPLRPRGARDRDRAAATRSTWS